MTHADALADRETFEDHPVWRGRLPEGSGVVDEVAIRFAPAGAER